MFGRKRNAILERANEIALIQVELDRVKTQQVNALLAAAQGCHKALVTTSNSIAEVVNRPVPDQNELMEGALRSMKETLALMAAGSALGKDSVDGASHSNRPTPEPTRITQGMVVRASSVSIDDDRISGEG